VVVASCNGGPGCVVRCDGGEVLVSAHVAPQAQAEQSCKYTGPATAECAAPANSKGYGYCVKSP